MKYNGIIESKLRVIEQKLDEINSWVKFRNFIVHRYERIDIEIVYAILKNKLTFFKSFIEDIRNS